MRRKSSYNVTYEKLVTNKKDYVGMVAYSLYKQELSTHLKAGKPKESFLDVNLTAKARGRYRKEAQDFMNTVLQINIEENLDKLKEPLAREIINISKSSLKPTTRSARFWSWHHSGLGGFVPTFYKTVILVIFVSVVSSGELLDSTVSKVKKYYQSLP